MAREMGQQNLESSPREASELIGQLPPIGTHSADHSSLPGGITRNELSLTIGVKAIP